MSKLTLLLSLTLSIFLSFFSSQSVSFAATQDTQYKPTITFDHSTIDHIEYDQGTFWAVSAHDQTGEWVMPLFDGEFNPSKIIELNTLYKNKPVTIRYDSNGNSPNWEDWTFIDAIIEAK